MLDLASFGKASLHPFAFGGVAFEIAASDAIDFGSSPEFARLIARDVAAPVVAAVRCNVSVERSLPPPEHPGLQIERNRDTAIITHALVRAELRRVGVGRYEARARIASEAPRSSHGTTVRPPDAALAAIAGAVVEQQGGLSMHAAAIELGGRAVLFIGPSGAGKSTAMQLVEGARVLAFDRVNLARDASGAYIAWALPGGTRVDAPRASQASLPLAALLRVRRGRERPRIAETTGASAVFAIRESTEVGDRSAAGEALRLEAAAELATRCVIGEIHTVLGAPHRALLHDFLSARAAVSALAREDCVHVEW